MARRAEICSETGRMVGRPPIGEAPVARLVQEIMTTRTRVAGIFALALALELVFVLAFVGTNRFPQLNSKQMGDSGVDIAVNLLAGRGYMQYFEDLRYELWRPPTFPLLLVALFAVVGKSYLAMRVMLATFGALTAVATFYLGRRLWGERVGTYAGVAVAVNPGTIFSSGLTGPENLIAFLLVVSILMLLRLRETQTGRDAALSGLVIGLVAMTKTFYVTFPLLAAAWLMFQPGSKRRLARNAAILCGGFLLVVAPWVVRNWGVLGKPRLTTTDAAMVFFTANTASWLNATLTHPPWPPPEYLQNLDKLKTMDELTRDKWFFDEAVASIRARPRLYVSRVLDRLWVMWRPYVSAELYPGLMSKIRVLVMASTFIPMMTLFFIGAWKLRGELKAFSIIYLLILAVTGSTALVHSVIRYRTPMEPLLILIAAFAAERLFASLRARGGILPRPPTRAGDSDPDGTGEVGTVGT